MLKPFSDTRYDEMKYRLCGQSGLKLPLISLGLWQNFGSTGNYDTQRDIVHRAFDLGITHFDMANVYGPPTGEAERNFGKILRDGLGSHRAELILSTKAGYRAWPGPYGDGGSKKNIITSCDQSLQRTGLDYFDIFYHHRMDTEVRLPNRWARSINWFARARRCTSASAASPASASPPPPLAIHDKNLTPLTSVMSRYNMFQRQDEWDKWPVALAHGIGGVAFSPLAQGLLSDKYLSDNPSFGRMADELQKSSGDARIHQWIKSARSLNAIAKSRDQSLAQMALAWTLRQPPIATALIGASSLMQIEQNVAALKRLEFSADELKQIEAIVPVAKNY